MILQISDDIVKELQEFAIYELKALPDDLLFHNIHHTRQVVSAVWEIGAMSGLSTRKIKIISAAAWFHDLRHKTRYIGHENESIRIAHLFLVKRQVDPVVIRCIEACIYSTRLPQNPTGSFQKILCDADLYHLSTKECLEKGNLLRQELQLKMNKVVEDDCWDRTNLYFLKKHQYFTDYSKECLQPRKERFTLSRLRRQIIARKTNHKNK